MHTVQHGVADPGNRAGRLRDVGHEIVGVAVAERGGHFVLVLQQELVRVPAGRAVEFHTSRQERIVGAHQAQPLRLLHEAVIGEVDPMEGVDVAQPPTRELQVGLEEEGHLTRLGMALTRAFGEEVEHLVGVVAPLGTRLGREFRDELLLTADETDVEQRRRGVEVAAGEIKCFVYGAHGVTELHAGVPDRIPDLLGDLGHMSRPAVDQQEVEVGSHAQVASAISPHRGQRHAPHLSDATDHRLQPCVDLGRVGARQRGADQRGVGQNRRRGRNGVHATPSVPHRWIEPATAVSDTRYRTIRRPGCGGCLTPV